MLKFFNKPYCIAIFVSIILIGFSTFVLLDTFVIPKTINNGSNSKVEDNYNSENSIDNTNESDENLAVVTDNSYEDSKIKITISTERKNDTTYYVADIVLKEASLLKTAFAQNTYGRNIKETTSTIADENNAILAINGDFYGYRNSGYVLRNGIIYRDTVGTDESGEDLVITTEGDFKIINEDEVSIDQLDIDNIAQILAFGPALVENGESVVDENDEVGKAMVNNPRTAIGQVGPLHYIMIVSDGRTNESEGFTLKELADIFVDKGCEIAYNLDGGGSSTMVFNGEIVNNPTTNGKKISEREVSDIVYIGY